uniref:CD74 molecule n=1 Tax=Taeniopygia guttata TaxID=59729 RepID=A0A674H9A8_TAEGU
MQVPAANRTFFLLPPRGCQGGVGTRGYFQKPLSGCSLPSGSPAEPWLRSSGTSSLTAAAVCSMLGTPRDAKPVNKMKMAKANTPLVMSALHPAPFEDFSAKAPASNKTEDLVKHVLLQADPSKMFPELKDNLMDNLKRLRSTMTHVDWKSFESWMHKWLLFEMAKNPQSEDRKAVPAAKVLTKCQAEATFGTDLVGHFRPQCDENGDYLPKQCNFTTGFCWCCYKNGTKIKDTDTREKLECPGTAPPSPAAGTPDPEEMIFSGVDMLKLNSAKGE